MSLSNVVMQPYKNGSQTAKNLAAQLSLLSSSKVRRLYTEGSAFVARIKHTVINWGRSAEPSWHTNACQAKIINSFDKVKRASNKLETFNCLRDAGNVPIPEYTTDRNVALEWINRGILVLSRTKLCAHSGAGIVLSAREEDLPEGCPLFVRYIKKKSEFRVHVVFGKVVDVQQKRKRVDYDGEVNYTVRNHHTGWVYCREDVETNSRLEEHALNSVTALGLDFGAVDIIYNSHADAYTVLEVNTAPGLEGTSVEKYANVFYEALK